MHPATSCGARLIEHKVPRMHERTLKKPSRVPITKYERPDPDAWVALARENGHVYSVLP
jgi:hypothetical protein